MRTLHTPEYIELITRLRNARKSRGVTQSEFARLLGKPQSFVSKTETGERRLDVLETIDFCLALEIKLLDVLPETARKAFE